MNKLVIAEKPSVAQTIAAVLGAQTKKDGYREGSGYIVSWCVGHLVELAPADAYDERYGKWRHEDLPILPQPWKYLVSERTKKQFAVLKRLMNDQSVDTVICATDAGREGELIFRLVYEMCKCRKPVKRLWISSLEEQAIQDGFASLKDGSEYDRLYEAALCRAQADWLVGINATRLFSLLYGQTLNVGRVMSPTLALVVQREAAIDAFAPETFYTVQLSCGMTAISERIKEKKDAEALAKRCHLGEAVVESVECKEKTENPPKLYDLTSLQRDANRLFGYTAQQTLDYTQSLYEKKLCTYPRTDSRYLTEDMAGMLPSLVRMVAAKLPFTAGMQLAVHPEQVVDNKKVSDHHAILPTGAMIQQELQALPIGEQSILQLLSVRLLCAVGDAHKYQECRVIVRCSDQPFTARGRTITQMGWKIPELTFRGAMGLGVGEQGEKEVTIPKLTKGQILSPVMADIKEGITSPPKHFTEDTLLSAIPHIDSTYRTIAASEGRAISGFSMGGGVAASMAFRYPYLFSSVIAYAGTYHHYYHPDYSTVGTPVDQAAEIYARMMAEKKFFDGSIIGTLIKNADIIRSSVKIALHVGTKDVLYCDNEILHLHLDTLQIPHEYKKYEGADHNLSLIVY